MLGVMGCGGCETTVVCRLLPPTELKTSSLETRWAGTEVNSVLSFTVISKIPGEVDLHPDGISLGRVLGL
jgi:hypothetical protein